MGDSGGKARKMHLDWDTWHLAHCWHPTLTPSNGTQVNLAMAASNDMAPYHGIPHRTQQYPPETRRPPPYWKILHARTALPPFGEKRCEMTMIATPLYKRPLYTCRMSACTSKVIHACASEVICACTSNCSPSIPQCAIF